MARPRAAADLLQPGRHGSARDGRLHRTRGTPDRAPVTGRGRRLGCVGVLVVLLVALAACAGEERPGPEGAAGALARGLSSGDLGAVTLTGTTAAEAEVALALATEGMGGLRPDVTVQGTEVAEGGDGDTATATATATLAVT